MSALRSSALCSLAFVLAATVSAQTTGGILGRVVDGSGASLPGVTVEARSRAVQGARFAETAADGTYRLALLPPGEYSVAFTLSGFAVEKRSGLVQLGKDLTLDMVLRPAAMREDITITAEAPVLDTTSSSVETNLSTRVIESLPTARNYASIVQVTPGVSSDANPLNGSQTTITVYGSSGAENAFYIDGVNTTNLEYGFQGKELNFEFISEVDVKAGGYEAEYGRATGGIVNVITKSGGNEFTGDLFGYYDSDSFQTNARSVVSTAGTQQGFRRNDFGADLGGYILHDRLWFFGAYDQVRNTVDSILPGGPHQGEVVASESRRNLGSAKLTFNMAPNQVLIATFLADPRVDTGAINDANHSLNGNPFTYLGRQDFGGRDYSLRYDGVFPANWIVSGQLARHREENSVGPSASEGNAIQYRDAANDFFQTGGFGLVQDKNFDRKHYLASVARLMTGHEIKAGLEYEVSSAEVTKRMSGGQQVDVFQNEVNPARPIYRHFYWTTPDATLSNAPVSALVVSPEHRVTTAFLQDRWSIGQEFVLNVGVRWDRQQIVDGGGVTQIDMKKDYAPRLGFTWNPGAQHRTKVFASFGQYYEEIPMDLVIRSFSYERQPRIVNYSPTSVIPDPEAESDFGTGSAILGGFTEPSDPNIRNQYLNEIILGGEREITTGVAIGIKGIYRYYGRVVEDFLCADDGTYCIGNPGEGIMKRVFTLDYSQTFPAPKPKRTFKGIQLDATRQFSNHWQALASYLFSRLDGNFDGEFAPFTNVGADPNISAAYDYYDFFTDGRNLSRITNKGPLSNDRRHQFKVSGLYEAPFGLMVGATAYWRSGTPLTRYGYSDAYGRYEFFLRERGAEGRTPANYEADIHLGYPVPFGRAKVNLLIDVFNVLNAQRAVLLDQRWGFQEADNQSPVPLNPGYGQPVLRTPPTSARLGVRVSF